MDVISGVLKAFQLAEELNTSQQFINILQFGKEQYHKGTNGARFEHLWPQSWQSAVKLLENEGYQDAVDYFICLNIRHPCSYGIFSGTNSKCQFCESPIFSGTNSMCQFCESPASSYIMYSYLPLRHKIRQW